jgi:hypothetical protein
MATVELLSAKAEKSTNLGHSAVLTSAGSSIEALLVVCKFEIIKFWMIMLYLFLRSL